MKKIWLLTVCCSMVFAEDSLSIIDASEEEIVIPATHAREEITMESFKSMAPSLSEALAENEAPQAIILPTQEVELQTEVPVSATPLATEQTLEVPAPTIVQQLQIEPEEDIAALEIEEKEVAEEIKSSGDVIDLGQVFSGSPTIYTGRGL